MAGKKISELDNLATLADDDLFVIVDDTDSTTKKLSYKNLKINGTINKVDTYADLPDATLHTGEFYVVLTTTGVPLINYHEKGLYYSNGAAWDRLDDTITWFQDNLFEIYDNVDNTKAVSFDVAGVTTETTRTLTVPDENGKIQLDISADTLEHTGFTNNSNITCTYDPTERKITLTGTFSARYNNVIIPELTDGWVSDAHGTDEGVWFLYHDGSDFVWSQTSWSFDQLQIAFVKYTSTDKFAIRETHGYMPWQSHKANHESIGCYKNSGGDISSYTVGSDTATDRRPLVSETLISDEDLSTTIAELATNSYTWLYLSGAAATTVFTLEQPEIVNLDTAQPYYNQYTGGAWQQTLLTANQYTNIWIIAIPVCSGIVCQKYRYLFMQGQTASTSLSTIQSQTPSNLDLSTITSISPELVFIGRIIIRYTANDWVITQVDELSGSQRLQISASASGLSSVSTDGSTLSGNGTVTNPLAVTGTGLTNYVTTSNQALTSAGYSILNNTGATVATFGAGGGIGTTFADGANFTGVISASAGSVAAPSINWGDAGTGIYKYGTDQIGIAAAGGLNVYFANGVSQFNRRIDVYTSIGGTDLLGAVRTFGQWGGNPAARTVCSLYNNPTVQNLSANSTATLGMVGNIVKMGTTGNLVAARTVTGLAGFADISQLDTALGTGGALDITNYYGMYLDGLSNALATGVTLTNRYGLYIPAYTIGTNKWGIYNLSRSFFNDDVFFGTYEGANGWVFIDNSGTLEIGGIYNTSPYYYGFDVDTSDGSLQLTTNSESFWFYTSGRFEAQYLDLTAATSQIKLGYSGASNYITTITCPTPAAARTITIPDAGADSSVVLTKVASTTDGNIPLFDGTTGTILKDSGKSISTIGYIDRGDPSNNDYQETGDKSILNTDGTWRDLDLSSIVPAGAKAVVLKVAVVDDAAGSLINFRKNGNSNDYATNGCRSQVSGVANDAIITVACDSNRVIEYNGTNVAFTLIVVTVTGWYI